MALPYYDWVEYPRARLFVDFEAEKGDINRFLVKLEYNLNWEYDLDDEWVNVVQFDHNPGATQGHDVENEGLHMDIYRDGEKYRVKDDFPPIPLNKCVDYCVSYIENNKDQLLRRFEKWHDIKSPR